MALLTLGQVIPEQQQALAVQSLLTEQPRQYNGNSKGKSSTYHRFVDTPAPVSQHSSDGAHQVAVSMPAPISHHGDGVYQVAQSTTAPLSHPTSQGPDMPARKGLPTHNHTSTRDTRVSTIDETQTSNIVPGNYHILDPEAASFKFCDTSLLHHGKLHPDLHSDWAQVQQVQAGGVGDLGADVGEHWRDGLVAATKTRTWPTTGHSPSQPETSLPFQLLDDLSDVLSLAPKQVHKVNSLLDQRVTMPSGCFIDKALPAPVHDLKVNRTFTGNYYIALHNVTAAPGIRGDGSTYPAYTPNHMGARVQLPHVGLRVDRWRHHLVGYDNAEIVQYIEFGFPLGLTSLPDLECTTRNHGSAYMWYDHVDKFICTEVTEGGLSGPFRKAPWWNNVISPLMTAHKKVKSRRTVFDASFGEKSLNNSTPSDYYMGLPCKYTFPKIQDYKEMILNCGPGAFMWKRDLSRFFLQLPLDPTEYHRVGVIWRGFFFFFVGLAFGLRHSGLQGQKVTDAVSWILCSFGREADGGQPYQVCNYVDDLGGVEKDKERATAAYKKLEWLLTDLGLEESTKKAEPPSTSMVYLGVQFDSIRMTMSVPPDKITEIKAEIGRWARKTTITKKELQSLLGKLFWVAKVVQHARPFMGRLLMQLRIMNNLKDNKKIKFTDESRKDILWWCRYLETFNGISMIVNDDPIPLSLEQLLDDPHGVCAGDATPSGGGAWHGREYWCGKLPAHLLDAQIPIHIKEFWILIVSAKLWGDTWTGKCVIMYCDNDSVCDTVTHKKPRDPALLSLLREFLFIVVSKKFFPVVRKIGTKENEMADYISRRFDREGAVQIFAKFGLYDMVQVKPRDDFFKLRAPW